MSILLAWVVAGVLLNFSDIGGSWERTKNATLKSKGHFKDFYPISEIYFAGIDDNSDVVICISGRSFSGVRPKKIVEYIQYKPVKYSIKLSKDELSNPSDNFFAVTPYNFSKKLDLLVYAYNNKNVFKSCPLESNLALFKKKDVGYNENRMLSIAINKYATYAISKYHGITYEKFIEKLKGLFPDTNEKVIYEIGSLYQRININNEKIRITGINGAVRTIYLPSNISQSGHPIILVGGYVPYEEKANYINLIFNIFADIILQPIDFLFYLIIRYGFILMGPE